MEVFELLICIILPPVLLSAGSAGSDDRLVTTGSPALGKLFSLGLMETDENVTLFVGKLFVQLGDKPADATSEHAVANWPTEGSGFNVNSVGLGNVDAFATESLGHKGAGKYTS